MKLCKIRVEGLPPSPNAIGRKHWAVQASHKREWTERVGWLAKTNRPLKPLRHARIHFCISVGSNRRVDPDNLLTSVCKPSLDGLKGVWIVDDSIDNVTLSFEFNRDKPKGFTITMLTS